MEYFWAFVIGGLICTVVQILMDNTKLQPGRIMVLLVLAGALLSLIGWYDPLLEFAGAGASVPLIGFGHTLMQGVKQAVEEQGLLGLFLGGFESGALGLSAALIFGYLASWLFPPRMKYEND